MRSPARGALTRFFNSFITGGPTARLFRFEGSHGKNGFLHGDPVRCTALKAGHAIVSLGLASGATTRTRLGRARLELLTHQLDGTVLGCRGYHG